VNDPTLLGYDKIGQVRWLADEICRACKKTYRLGKFVCINKLMVGYKEKYYPLTLKTKKWSIKIWCLASSVTKYVFSFFIYCDKADLVYEETLAYLVVMNLVEALYNVGHVVLMDNYFTSIGLFKELFSKGFGATSNICSNCIGLPNAMRRTKEFNKMDQGSLDWRMHESRGISSVLWKNKQMVLLISTSAIPIGFPCVLVDSDMKCFWREYFLDYIFGTAAGEDSAMGDQDVG
jgi:hypothetical protein